MTARVSANAGWARHRDSSVAGPLRHIVAGAVCIWLSGCGGPATGPEEAVRQWVRDGHQAAEEKDRRALVNMISTRYSDARGNGRDDIENMLRLYFLRSNKVAFITNIDTLNVIDDSAAELVLSVGMAGTNDNVMGFSADVYRFEMELEHDGDAWRLIAARWSGFGDEMR
jgi:hypothetical protein